MKVTDWQNWYPSVGGSWFELHTKYLTELCPLFVDGSYARLPLTSPDSEI